jgi:GDP-L-fucose synthase
MKVLIFGANGLVGSSTVNILSKKTEYTSVIGSTRKDTNLFSYQETFNKIDEIKPNIVINAAAKVGGILANNTMRTEFILENLKINLNILESLKSFPEIKLINLGSSCIYPLGAKNPIKEEYIMTGSLEPTNSPYAMAKLTAIEIGDALNRQYGNKIVNLMPTNLYGPNDNFSENESHVIPGLISRMHKAKLEGVDRFDIWGTGKPLREFLYSEDLAEAIHFVIRNEINEKLLNVGSGEEISIEKLSELVKKIVSFEGSLNFDNTKPDGNPRKLLDSSRIFNLGWKPTTSLQNGISRTYKWYLDSIGL